MTAKPGVREDALEELRDLKSEHPHLVKEMPLRHLAAETGCSPAAIELATEIETFPVVRVLEGAAPPPPAVHVKDLAVDRDINVIGAPGGHGKTVSLFSLAVGTVTGRPVFGTLTVKRPGPVLLVIPEDGQAVARMIVDAMIEGEGLSPNDRATLAEGLVMVSDESIVNITRDTRRLAQTALDYEAVMMIGDPLCNLLGGADENDNGLAGLTCDTIRRDLCRGADLTVCLSHHLRKPGQAALADAAPTMNDLRGGGAWVNGARLALGISKKQNRLTITGLKANRIKADLRHELDLAIEADPDNAAHWLTCRLTDANTGASSESFTPGVGRAINANERAALTAIDDRLEPGARFSNSRWQKESGITSENTFRSVKDRLLDAGLAVAEKTGRLNPNGKSPVYQYGITDRGRATLNTGWTTEGVKL